jgi:iron complex transport system substrate-binding protein
VRLLAAAGLAFAASGASAAPVRVASLNLAADEVLVDILPAERLVSVTRWVDDPTTSNIVGRVPPSVFRFPKADMEKLVSLAPDLVVVSQFSDADLPRLLERAGMRHHRMEGLTSLAGVRSAILDLGKAVGAEEPALRLVARYDEKLQEVSRRIAGAKRPRVLYWSGGLTAGADTSIGAIIEAAGGVNVGAELGVSGVSSPGDERAFVSDPDVILIGDYPKAEQALRSDALLSRTRAVREGHVVVMPNALLIAISQYTADAVWDLAHRLHPDRVPRP